MADARLDQFDKDEWRAIARGLGLIGEAFEKAWADFAAAKLAKAAN